MKQVIISFAFILIAIITNAQVTNSEKLIKLGESKELKGELQLEDGKRYALSAKDVKELFPSLVKEKKVSERFGKNAYRTKTITVVDETQLLAALVTALKEQTVEISELKKRLRTIETKM